MIRICLPSQRERELVGFPFVQWRESWQWAVYAGGIGSIVVCLFLFCIEGLDDDI